MLNDYKVENLELMNMKKVGDKFVVENDFTEEEKKQFIDAQADGIASYMLELTNKYKVDSENLPKDSYGKVKTVSLKAWLNKNDIRNIIDNDYKYGNYYMFGHDYYNIKCDVVAGGEYSNYALYSNGSLINQWFHDLLNELYYKEINYFKENDSRELKLKELKLLGNMYGIFNSVTLSKLCGMGHTELEKSITEDKLDYYISLYDRFKQLSQEVIKELIEASEEMYNDED